jgi:hypothetical protein
MILHLKNKHKLAFFNQQNLQVGTTNRKDNVEACLLWRHSSASQEALLSLYLFRLLFLASHMQLRFPVSFGLSWKQNSSDM